jgi:predicted PurR-regulated permease PerM
VAIIYIVAHPLEGSVIQPLVVARTTELHPAAVAGGVVAVDRLFGFVGLVVAVPILATVKILIEELWIYSMELRAEVREARRLHEEATVATPVEQVTG